MIILHAEGQTGNKFFTYLRYIGDSLETLEKIVILSPDISIKYYPFFLNNNLVNFPFYFHFISRFIGYQNNIKILHYIFGNKYITKVLEILFKFIPYVHFIVAPTGSNQSKNHFKHIVEIKKIFTPSIQITQSVETIFEKIKTTNKIICGVHLRFGDYKTFQGGKYYFSKQQYHSKILELKASFPEKDVAFFISSNEKIDLSEFTECHCFTIPDGNPIKDLYGLSLSDYIIGPPSTFSGWASYYGNTPIYFIEDLKKKIDRSSFYHIFDVWD